MFKKVSTLYKPIFKSFLKPYFNKAIIRIYYFKERVNKSLLEAILTNET